MRVISCPWAICLVVGLAGCGSTGSSAQPPSPSDAADDEPADAAKDSSAEVSGDGSLDVSLDSVGDAGADSPWDGEADSLSADTRAPEASDAWLDGGGNPFKMGPVSGAILHVGYGADSDGLAEQDIPALLDELRSIGMDTVVVNQTRAKRADAKCFGGAGDFEWVAGFPDKMGVILDAAHARSMKVWIGTTMSTTACSTFYLPPNSELVRKDVASSMAEIHKKWGNHPAFEGWYIPDEPGQLLPFQDGHFYNVTYELKKLDKNRPVMVCPYLVGVVQSPADLAKRAAAFRDATGIDVQAWQDSVGAGAVKLAYWSRSGYSLSDYFTALSASLGDGLWADTELFNWGEPLFNATGLTGGYRSASATRLQGQLDGTTLAKKRISWLPQYHMSSFGPANGYPEAPRLLATYRALHGYGGKSLKVQSYEWLTAPSSTYPDTLGTELIDGRVGDPKSVTEPGWVGLQGEAELVVDLGADASVDWLSVHLLVNPSWSILSPTAMHLSCSLDKLSFHPLQTLASPVASGNYEKVVAEEYVFGNTAPLKATTCRYLKVRLENASWTFLSEIEVSSP